MSELETASDESHAANMMGWDGGPIGREREAIVVAAFLDAVERGPGVMAITGQVGIGKSTVWRALLAEARRRGYRTLEARAVEAEVQLAFGGLADLLNPWVDEALDQLPAAQRLALEVALQRVPVATDAPPALALSMATLGVLRGLADTAPLIVAVDDLPWLDGPSARVLGYALRRLQNLRVGFTPTVRTEREDAALPFGPSDVSAPIERLNVGPLELDAIDALIRHRLDLSLRRPSVARIHALSTGNPFHALEIGRALQRAGPEHRGYEPHLVPGLARTVAPNELVQGRLLALPASARQALACAAMLHQPTAELVDSVVPDAADGLESGRVAGVVELEHGRIQFTHPLLAAGAIAQLDPAESRDLHARLAAVVTEPGLRARHLALASGEPAEPLASELESAAVHAWSRGGSDEAADLALLAASRTPPADPDGLHRRTIATAGYLIQAGDPTRARGVLERYIDATLPESRRGDALRVLADARSSDDSAAKVRLLEEALVQAADDHGLRSRILEALSHTRYQAVVDAPGLKSLASEAVREAEEHGDPVARCSAYLTAAWAHHVVGDGERPDLLSLAADLEPSVQHLRVFFRPALMRALIDLRCDRLDRAAETLGPLLDQARAAGDWDSLPMIASILSRVDFRRGHWTDAQHHAAEAVGGSRLNGQDPALAWALTERATVEAALGDEAAAVRDAEEGIRAASRSVARAPGLGNEVVLAQVAASLGHASEAVERYEQAVRPWLDAGYRDPSCVFAIGEWAEALVSLGRLEEAAARLEAFEADAVRLDRPSARAAALRVHGLIATAQGDEAAATVAFAAALAQHERVPEPFERARTLLAQGESLRRFRRRGQARDPLREAVAIFERLDAPRWRERATAELARTGHRAAGAPLTTTERQVAELVAAGKTNREVGAMLFMSPHTVEAHLTRVYRSLGVRGRTELARELSSRAGGSTGGRGSATKDGGQG